MFWVSSNAMHVTVRYRRNLQFEASSRGHTLLSDQPLDNGGDDLGMTPPEWMLSSLGSCVGFYAVKYCEARNIDPTGLTVDVSAEKTTESPIRLDAITVHIHLPVELEERHQKGLLRAADACIIHNTLAHPPTLTTQVTTGNGSLVQRA